MADITLVQNPDNVDLNFTFDTPQQFYYTVEVIDNTGKQIFHDIGSSDAKTSFGLGNANSLIGLYLTITWTAIDPAGAGNTFSANATAVQDDVPKGIVQNYSGTTTATHASAMTVGKFIS